MFRIEDLAKQARDHYYKFLSRKNKIVYRRRKKIYGPRGPKPADPTNKKAFSEFYRNVKKLNGGTKWRQRRRYAKAINYAYNAICSRQDHFGQAMFPTIKSSFDVVGNIY